MALIESIRYDKAAPEKIRELKYGEDWPVVYIINNTKEAYIGETVNAAKRAAQHFKKDERKRLTQISLIGDDTFNKSVILDLEAFLINHISADGRFMLQNSNMGTQPHRYYQREKYEKEFYSIWNELKKNDIVRNEIRYIQNSDLFKYSPYKTLNVDQYRVVDEIVEKLAQGESGTIVVNGGAGTGKTVLATYLVKLLSEIGKKDIERSYDMDPGYEYIADNLDRIGENGALKIGFVVPMQSLRKTIKNVFKGIKGLKTSMVLSTLEVPKDYYDLLIVDEAHRLKQRKALSDYKTFDERNRKFGLGNEGTELDWILKSSRNQIFFYDSMQSVKPSDVDKERFDELISSSTLLELKSQFRCAGGNDYIEYVRTLLSDNPPEQGREILNYDLAVFDDPNKMIDAIREKDREFDLCRVVAGYAWKWKSKKNSNAYDIVFGDRKYRWNTENKDWVNSADAVNEIGCIHTVQGYDLNYAGVIFGDEIKYDRNKEEIYIDKSNYYDLQGKTSLKSHEELKEYILNIYRTLMTRGIKGTYVYACDDGMREYLHRYMEGKE